MQELFRYDDSWTGTVGSGGSGHSVAQEDAALVEEGFEFEGPCSLMVSVNESYAVVLEGKEEGELFHEFMGVYERVEGKEVNGRGVWQALGSFECFLYYWSSKKNWMVGGRESMDTGDGNIAMCVKSTALTPDQITEQWKVCDNTRLVNAPKLRVRVSSSVEKHAAEQRMEQEQVQALEMAHQSRMLVVEGLVDDLAHLMGAYSLMEGKVVSGRAVWQKQGGDEESFLYSSCGDWIFSIRKYMEKGSDAGYMKLTSASLTPDQAHPSAVWESYDGTDWVAKPEVQVRRQQ
jgi:hypothetical protein